MAWLYSLVSVLIVSLIAFVGLFTLSMKLEKLKKIIFFLVSFAAGALLGDAFIHLIPEAYEEFGISLSISLYFLSGILLFFILEKFIHWRHCHVPTSKEHPHPFAVMNLVGDMFHNFIDGMVIAGSYLMSIPLGVSTTIAVVLHEIPQEIGDFGVLIHGGFTRAKALLYNFLIALTAVLGAVVVLLIGNIYEGITMFLLPFTAGGFIYVAGSDLIPELHRECAPSKSLLQLFGLILGISVMLLMLLLE
ncbi:ZIP family metal transporter [Candidatus Woesearchaeota archaeon]|nr:ZIP family metal transporter [Candidatus Woesearchaeota archaeon]